ncbi:DUF1289 domain-containing protein [Bowmanella sp. JS7-9]|uniref:DUF1289 domain-containing protein n=1 Tax=Pseudobowmanella zhangzhouensis TaxID=1537679 RepID=A0ABW1XGB4_9ALTE|nr:DUF1289 domain-containing protein [Bowmanella sp. JS7-9]TBX21415.1 hypothetical protein TK45_12785 [Bowmanella sp. JS7-9]
MEQLEFFDIPSPCIGVCQSGPKGYCLGCYRSRDERLYWIQLTPDVKRQVIKVCAMRKRRAEMANKNKPAQPPPEQGDLFGD